MDNQIQNPESGVGASSTILPGYRALVSDAFTKSFTSWPLFILLAGTGIVTSVCAYLLEFNTTLRLWEMLALTVVMFAAVIANVLATVVAIKYFMNDATGEILNYFREVLGSAWSYLWILFLSTLVIFSGFILFVIPGFILSVYLMFALYVRATDTTATGMNALTRSTELVRGYWWALAGRMIVLTIAIIVVFLLAGFALGLLVVIAGVSETASDLLSLLAFEPVFSALGSIICLYAFTLMYRALVAAKAGVVSETSSVRGLYIALALLTPFLLVGVLALIALGYMNEFQFIDPAVQEQILLEMDGGV